MRIIKQNLKRDSEGSKFVAKKKWQRRDSNPRPKAYEVAGRKQPPLGR